MTDLFLTIDYDRPFLNDWNLKIFMNTLVSLFHILLLSDTYFNAVSVSIIQSFIFETW